MRLNIRTYPSSFYNTLSAREALRYGAGLSSIPIRTRSSLILIIQLRQDLKILDDDIDMRTGSLSGTILVNKRSDLKILDP
ncbi:MEI2-like protein 5 [Prunus dulcis]|uniref:MEI2-like protein 5 n=1 Tax=Prunus dulcis TaxID=3755 RepID=A0A4Y1RN16_PRUDU|nr:MEI2-like protein 5 [Prunus dulcis]